MKATSLGGKRPKPKYMTEVERKCNKSRSAEHEDRLQGVLRSKATPNSGALPNISFKGDLQDDLFVWQAKLTERDRYTLTADVLVELQRQASLNSKWPAMAITMEALPRQVEQDWVALPSSVFAELIDIYRRTDKK
jgi:hypothetical protein